MRAEQAARLRHQRDAAPDDRLGRQAVDPAALETDAAAMRADHAQDGLHRGRLARGVAAEQADDLALAHASG